VLQLYVEGVFTQYELFDLVRDLKKPADSQAEEVLQ